MKKRVIVSVTSDLVTDQRVHKVSQTLHDSGYSVLLVGRQLTSSLALEKRNYETRRFRLWFTKKFLFYINYNFTLFLFLISKKADVLLANDLDTLPASYLAAVLKRIPLVYDSHEYYTGVPELQNRRFIRKIWETIEGFIFPRLAFIYTVNDSIAKLYADKYRKGIKVVRNAPYYHFEPEEVIAAPGAKRILIYQGSGINVNRGAEELVASMQFLDPSAYELWLVGGGDVYHALGQLATDLGVSQNIRFISKVPFEELKKITKQAHLGLSLDKPSNINYLYSLPNKVFDYIHAGLPVLSSRLPEIAKVIEKYEIGSFIQNHEPQKIAEAIKFMFSDPLRYECWKGNTKKAAEELCWQKENQVILEIFTKAVRTAAAQKK